MNHRPLLLVLVVLAALCGACSGDDEERTTTSTPERSRAVTRTPLSGSDGTATPGASDTDFTPTTSDANLPVVMNAARVWVASVANGTAEAVTTTPGGYGALHWTDPAHLVFRASLASEDELNEWDGRRVNAVASVGPGRYAWTADNKRLAFITPNGELYVTGADGSSKLLAKEIQGDLPPLWSPDSLRIAYTAGVTDSAGVFVVGADGGEPKLVSPAAGDDLALGWSANGRYVTFHRTQPDGTSVLLIADWDQTKEQLLGFVAQPESDADALASSAWSPSGRFVAWRDGPLGGSGETHLLDTATQDEYTVADVPAEPVWAPDSSFVALVRPDGVAIQSSDNSEPRVVTQATGEVAWSPDSASFVVYGGDGQGATRVDAISGSAAVIEDSPIASVAWSPDSSALLLNSEAGLLLFDSAAGGSETLHDAPVAHAAWSPDSTRLAFCDRSATPRVTVVTLSDGSETAIPDTGCDAALAWSPDGSQIGGTTASHPAGSRFVLDLEGGQLSTYPAGLAGPVAWSPDLDEFAALVAGPEGVTLVAGPADGGEAVDLGPISGVPVWSAEGSHLAWISPDGAPHALDGGAERSIDAAGATAVGWCGGGTARLIVVESGAVRIEQADGSLQDVLAPEGIALAGPVSASSDCRVVAVGSVAGAGNPDLLLVRDGEFEQLANTPDTETAAAVSPNGEVVVFRRANKDGARIIVRTLDDPGAPTTLTAAPNPGDDAPQWLDDTHLGFAAPEGMRILDLRTGESAEASTGRGLWSADGQALATIDGSTLSVAGTRGGSAQVVARALTCQLLVIEDFATDGGAIAVRIETPDECSGQ